MEYIIKQFRGYPCELDMSKMHVTRSSYGIIFPKDSPYINIFRQTIKKHRSAGLYNQLFEHHRQKYNTDVADKCQELDILAFREVDFLTISCPHFSYFAVEFCLPLFAWWWKRRQRRCGTA